MHPQVYCSLVYISQDTKQPLSTDGWMDKGIYVYRYIYIDKYNGILFSHKKEWTLLYDNMNGPWGPYAKWIRSDRERSDRGNQHFISTSLNYAIN